MRERLLAAIRDRRFSQVGDLALALLLAGTALIPVLAGVPAFGRPTPVALVLALVSTLPLAWRTRSPITVATVLLVATGLDLLAAAPHEGALQPFVALVLAGYTVGSRSEGRHSIVLPACLAVLAVPVFALALGHGQALGNEVTSYIWLIAAWGVGRVVRGMRINSRELEAANAELAEHREVAIQAAAALERGRIARELHDVIAHNVSMMVVQAGAALRVLRTDEPDVRSALETIATTGRQTVDEMRGLLGVLRATNGGTDLAPQPGLADLDQLVERLRLAGVSVTCRVEGDRQPLPRGLDLSAYRIVQEALTNTVKHARGAHVTVVVAFRDASLDLDITNSGAQGVASSPGTGTGHGLVGIQERAALFGGQVTAARTADGFQVTATLPLPVSTSA